MTPIYITDGLVVLLVIAAIVKEVLLPMYRTRRYTREHRYVPVTQSDYIEFKQAQRARRERTFQRCGRREIP